MKKEISSRVVIVVIAIALIVVIVIGYAVFVRRPKAEPLPEDTSSSMYGTPKGMYEGAAAKAKAAGKQGGISQGQPGPPGQ